MNDEVTAGRNGEGEANGTQTQGREAGKDARGPRDGERRGFASLRDHLMMRVV